MTARDVRPDRGVLLRLASEHNLMAYSGTVSQTNFSTRRVIEAAARRCGRVAQQLTSEDVSIAMDCLYTMLSALANDGAPLWCIQRSIYPLYDGNAQVVTYSGTVDVMNANLRTLREVTGTTTVGVNERVVDFGAATTVATVGLKWSAASAPIQLARSDDGVTWSVIQSEATSAVNGEWTWFDLASAVSARYFRVQATSGTLDLSRLYLGNTPTEIPLARLNRDDYTSLPNKTFKSSRPLQYWLDRQSLSPVMQLWPMPDATAETSQVIVWAQRHIMDVGTMAQNIEVPQRWYDAVVAGLAAKLIRELPDVDLGRAALLDNDAAKAMYSAQQEERDNSPLFLTPAIGGYTR